MSRWSPLLHRSTFALMEQSGAELVESGWRVVQECVEDLVRIPGFEPEPVVGQRIAESRGGWLRHVLSEPFNVFGGHLDALDEHVSECMA